MPGRQTCVCLYQCGNSPAVSSLADGFKINGYEVVTRDVNYFSKDQAGNFMDITVVHGLRGKFLSAANYHRSIGNDLLVFDFGYLERVNSVEDMLDNYWSIGFDGFGWTPEFDCDSKRLDALSVKIERTQRKPEKVIYVCGQMSGDASHRMTDSDLKNFYNKTVSELKAKAAGKFKVVFRPHPRSPEMTPDNCEIRSDESLDDVLRKAHCIVTYNSTVGIDAMRFGCPVVCDKSAYYKDFSNSFDADIEKLFLPSEEQVKQYYCKLSYAQWKLEECKKGLPVKFLMDNKLIKPPNGL